MIIRGIIVTPLLPIITPPIYLQLYPSKLGIA